MKKEKSTRTLTVMLQPQLYEAFEKKCEKEYRTVSELVREFVSKYVCHPQTCYPGGLIDPIQPIWGNQEWLMYQQLPNKEILEKKFREEIEKEYKTRLEEAYAHMQNEIDKGAEVAEQGYQEAWQIIMDSRERMDNQEKEYKKKIKELEKQIAELAPKDNL